MDKQNLPIGFLDSGLGGISVLKEAIKILPNEDYIYYGDSKHAPYGTKSIDEIKQLTFNVVHQLMEQGIKALVVACNTATSAAINDLRKTYPDFPIIGIEPAIKPAVEHAKGKTILALATPMTVKQEKFQHLLSLYQDQAHIVSIPCKGLMEFVEKGDLNGPFLEAYFNEHVLPYMDEDTSQIVLGCTHYPFLKPYLKNWLGDKRIDIIDGSKGTALELKRKLEEKNLLNPNTKQGTIRFENSLDQQEIYDLCWKLLRLDIDE